MVNIKGTLAVAGGAAVAWVGVDAVKKEMGKQRELARTLTEQLQTAGADRAALTQRLTAAEQRISQLEAQLQQQSTDGAAAVAVLDDTIQGLLDERAALQVRMQHLTEELEAAGGVNATVSQQLADTQWRILALTKQLQQLEKRSAAREAELTRQLSTSAANLHSISSQLDSTRASLKAARAEANAAAWQLAGAKGRSTALTQQLMAAKAHIAAIEQQLMDEGDAGGQLAIKLVNLKAQLQQQEAAAAAQEEYLQQQLALATQLQQQEAAAAAAQEESRQQQQAVTTRLQQQEAATAAAQEALQQHQQAAAAAAEEQQEKIGALTHDNTILTCLVDSAVDLLKARDADITRLTDNNTSLDDLLTQAIQQVGTQLARAEALMEDNARLQQELAQERSARASDAAAAAEEAADMRAASAEAADAMHLVILHKQREIVKLKIQMDSVESDVAAAQATRAEAEWAAYALQQQLTVMGQQVEAGRRELAELIRQGKVQMYRAQKGSYQKKGRSDMSDTQRQQLDGGGNWVGQQQQQQQPWEAQGGQGSGWNSQPSYACAKGGCNQQSNQSSVVRVSRDT